MLVTPPKSREEVEMQTAFGLLSPNVKYAFQAFKAYTFSPERTLSELANSTLVTGEVRCFFSHFQWRELVIISQSVKMINFQPPSWKILFSGPRGQTQSQSSSPQVSQIFSLRIFDNFLPEKHWLLRDH